MATSGPLGGRVVVITGAAQGIGEAAARALVAHGATVVLIDSDSTRLAEVAHSLGPSVAVASVADVRRSDELRRVVEEIGVRGLGVDTLVNNAGVYAQGAILEISEDDLRRCIDVNVLGLLAASRAMVPLMRGRPGALILNVLSEFAWLPFPNKAAYCISKAAAAMASSCLRTELAPMGIDVTDFVPPAVDTGLVRRASSTNPTLLAREIEVVRANAWPAEAVGLAIAQAIRRPRAAVSCGWTTRSAIIAARCFPVTASRLAARAARRMGLA